MFESGLTYNECDLSNCVVFFFCYKKSAFSYDDWLLRLLQLALLLLRVKLNGQPANESNTALSSITQLDAWFYAKIQIVERMKLTTFV